MTRCLAPLLIVLAACVAQPPTTDIASDLVVHPPSASVVDHYVDPNGLHPDAPITLPSGTMPTNGWPLVIPFHRYSGTHTEALSRLGFGNASSWPASPIADKAIILWPDGRAYANGFQLWNATTGCCDPNQTVDDIAYVQAAYAYVDANYTLDHTKRTVMGLSNGGFMAEAMMCAHPETWDRAVDASGGAPKPCSLADGSHTISILKDHGTADTTIFWNSTTPTSNTMTFQGMGDSYPAADDASQYGCSSFTDTGVAKDFESTTGNETEIYTGSNCPTGTTITLLRANGGIHSPSWTTSKWQPYVMTYMGL